MDQVAQLPAEDRAALFRETAEQMGIGSAVVIEKDFWVCWTLKHIFSLPDLPALLFKGGTSLSKAFGLIERFSEDIDLSLHRADLGFHGDDDPLNIEGTKARRRKIAELSKRCKELVRETMRPALSERFESLLTHEEWNLEPAGDDSTQLDLDFQYPSSLDSGDYGSLEYIKPTVRLEIGARSDHQPCIQGTIESYAALHFPKMFAEPKTSVATMSAERTFWEKATIFHAENHRPPQDELPPAWTRLSRHAYDLAMMERNGVAERAIADRQLLQAVSRHKNAFYYTKWANYDTALHGTFRLSPNDLLRSALHTDYERMRMMFFGDPPAFEELVMTLARLDSAINQT